MLPSGISLFATQELPKFAFPDIRVYWEAWTPCSLIVTKARLPEKESMLAEPHLAWATWRS